MRLNSFEREVNEYIKDNSMLGKKGNIILGVSGGADSICLFCVLLKLSREWKKEGIFYKLKVVHINHMIRETATRDEEFVKNICQKYSVHCKVIREDVSALAKDKHISVEEAGRYVRYEAFLNEVEGKEDVIAVAHNLNDRAETVMFNMFRGSGLKGMAGILPVSCRYSKAKVIRPLLSHKREAIEDYLCEINQDFVTDETNLSLDYTRNVIRNRIFKTATENVNLRAVENVAAAGEFVKKALDCIDKIVQKEYAEIVLEKPEIAYLNRDKLIKADEFIVEEIIKKAMVNVCGRCKDITSAHIESVKKIFFGDKNKIVNLPYQMVARNSYNNLIIEIIKSEDKPVNEDNLIDISKKLLEGKEVTVDFMGSGFKFKLVSLKNCQESDKTSIKNIINEKNNYTKCFDYDKILGSLALRTRKNGDYMIISPKGTKKKIKSIFIDEKVEVRKREEYVLLASQDKVYWIVGFRGDCSAYVDEHTENILICEMCYGKDKSFN